MISVIIISDPATIIPYFGTVKNGFDPFFCLLLTDGRVALDAGLATLFGITGTITQIDSSIISTMIQTNS